MAIDPRQPGADRLMMLDKKEWPGPELYIKRWIHDENTYETARIYNVEGEEVFVHAFSRQKNDGAIVTGAECPVDTLLQYGWIVD